MENVNDSYFDGIYKDLWRTIIPEILTEKEINFIVSYFDLKPGDKVLDLMCGYGRHTLALARLGINVTAVDNLKSYTTEIEEISRKERLPVEVICENVLKYAPKKLFDLVICMGNSLNFYNEDDTLTLLTKVSKSLKSNGNLLLNTWSIAEIISERFIEEGTGTLDGVVCKISARKLFNPLRIQTISTFITPEGNVEVKEAIDYIFSIEELEVMLNKSGFRLLEVYSIPGKKKFLVGDPRAYFIAEKNI